MRLLYVVQRYGPEVAGGAELHCRQFAEHLAARGHDVEVLSSCARSYVDWADVDPPGTSELNGVTVHRLPVVAPRQEALFDQINARTVWAPRPIPLHLQRSWLDLQGPTLDGLVPWLEERAGGYDAAAFITYMYHPTVVGLPVAAGLTATVLHPTAHDEPPLYLPQYEMTFRAAHAHAYLTLEERAVIHRRFRLGVPGAVVGIGVDEPGPGDPAGFRAHFGLGDRPYLLFVGRVDPSKGSTEMFEHFVALKARHPGDLALVVVGEPVVPLPEHPDVVVTGFVSEADKASALDGALALVQPSYYESFSMVLTEAWARGVPALVQGRCDVLRGQSVRSGGGIPYEGFAAFEAAVQEISASADLRRALGQAGRDYVRSRYSWDTVLDRYEGLLSRVTRRRPRPATVSAG